VYLRRRGDSIVCSVKPSPVGPLRSRARARLAARALRVEEVDEPARALPRLRARLQDLVECRRFEDAARLRDRIAAVEDVVRSVQRIERARRTRCCVIVPSTEPGCARGIFVANGRIADVRTLASPLEVDAGLAAAERTAEEEDLDELMLVQTFLRRPPPELRVAPLERDAILRSAAALPRALTRPAARRAPARARAA
jgi:excinuclease UvrABC nuclease subunit